MYIRGEKNMENKTLATEMLHEIKAQSKRWFIISIILLIALIGSNIGWLIYESQYETIADEKSQETYYTDSSTITQNIE